MEASAQQAIQRKYEVLGKILDERGRRFWAAAEAGELGRGGVSLVARATGLSRTTIYQGMAELQQGGGSRTLAREHVRAAGGGRRRLTEKDPQVLTLLKQLVEPTTRGDPESPLRWTCKSTRQLADVLREQGHPVGRQKICELLGQLGYSLQANRKTHEGSDHADRDAQFEYINAQVKAHQDLDQPVISVDTKKKELVGDFKNAGRDWRPKGEPQEVRTHDFMDRELGKVNPYGVYDQTANTGWVSVGTDHDTAEFAVETIRRWWLHMGSGRYPNARELLITADGGGSNGYRLRQLPQNNVTLAVACASLRRYSRITPSTKLIEMEKAETQLTDAVIRTIRDAARKLTGRKRRQFQAQVALDYFGGSARKAQTVFGWSGKTVALGLNELRTGITCVDSFAMRGRRKSEDAQPQLLEDIVALVEPQSQADPKFQGRFQYTRMTAKAVRQALIDEKDWTDEQLPHENTIGVILNRLGYRLRRVQKRKPIKRVKETDAIFETVHEENKKSDQRGDSLRISIDTKAKVNVGPFSRHGQSRGAGAVEAADHDFEPEHKLVPFGILDVMAGWLTIIFGTSRETSDFIVDCLQQWWHDNQGRYGHITQLVINLDNGPELQSRRTQFMARMVEFAEQTGLEIVLVYYPPYHSKYNPIERCWGILEMHWNGSLLDSIETVCDWARTMTWKRIAPAVRLLDRVYEKGVSLTKQAFEAIERRLQRDERLPKYHVVIQPTIT